MIFWLNAQLPPSLAKWLTETFGVNAITLQEFGFRMFWILRYLIG